MAQFLEILPIGRQGSNYMYYSILSSQYNGSWYPIDAGSQGLALLTLKSFYLKAFSRKHGCDWLMLKHQPITATLSAKSF